MEVTRRVFFYRSTAYRQIAIICRLSSNPRSTPAMEMICNAPLSATGSGA